MVDNRKETRRKLRQEVSRELLPLAIGSVSMLASSLANQALPRLVGRLLDQSDRQRVVPTLSLVVLGGGVASFMRTTLLGQSKDAIASRLREEAFRSLLMEKDLEWFQTESMEQESDKTGVTVSSVADILSNDVEKISTLLTTSMANLLRSMSAMAFSTYHMLALNPSLFAASAAIVPIIGSSAMLLHKSIKRIAERQRALQASAADFVEERLQHLTIVKLSNRERDEVERYRFMQQENLALDRRAAWQQGALMGFLFCASSGALLLVVELGGRSVARGRMTSGQLTSFCTYSFLLGVGSSGLVRGMGEMMAGMLAADRYYRLLGEGSDNTTVKESRETLTEERLPIVQSVSFQDVCFSYKSTGAQVLRNISFTLERGEVTALVGKNGSGKSTAAALLAGLHKPSSGRILLDDGTDLAQLSSSARRRLIQVVPQATALFNLSILENVRYSTPLATKAQALEALRRANAEYLLAKRGLDFVVGLNGSKLSGGERQRLALARALISDPAILVMDEPASALDSEGESAVAEAMAACRSGNQNGKDRALLLISHHVKSLKLVDKVLVMKDGVISETGGFKELQSRRTSELCQLMPDLLNE